MIPLIMAAMWFAPALVSFQCHGADRGDEGQLWARASPTGCPFVFSIILTVLCFRHASPWAGISCFAGVLRCALRVLSRRLSPPAGCEPTLSLPVAGWRWLSAAPNCSAATHRCSPCWWWPTEPIAVILLSSVPPIGTVAVVGHSRPSVGLTVAAFERRLVPGVQTLFED